MSTIAVYPGRFHPFSLGHKAVYDNLSADPKINNAFILTTDKQDQDKSPFSYDDKITMMTKAGVPISHIIQVKNPYKIDEIVKKLGLDPNQDRLIYALGSDDANRFDYTPTSPLQRYSAKKKMQPVGRHAYVKVIPQISYNILGKKLTHASDIRKMYQKGNNNDRNQIIADLYGSVDPIIRAIFDKRLGTNNNDPVEKLQENIQKLQGQLRRLKESALDYIDERSY